MNAGVRTMRTNSPASMKLAIVSVNTGQAGGPDHSTTRPRPYLVRFLA